MSGWQPIETAPKDELVEVIGSDGIKSFGMMYFESRWVDAFSDAVFPTHWMPLPPPPTPA